MRDVQHVVIRSPSADGRPGTGLLSEDPPETRAGLQGDRQSLDVREVVQSQMERRAAEDEAVAAIDLLNTARSTATAVFVGA